jgi:transcriptional regulator with XRE-family HTH domain
MKFPVYRFSDVLRALRNETDLTVLRAAELTGYGNYERWESGQTRVRPEYLAPLADVFGIEGDLWLLTYAWLLDRYTPPPGGGRVEFTHQRLSGILRRLPKGSVVLGDHNQLVVRPMSHGQLALACLVARYGPSYAGADSPLVLTPTRRTPAAPLDSLAYILDRYADVVGDLARYVARTFLLAGIGQAPREIAVAVFRSLLLLLTEPEPFASVLESAASSSSASRRGLDGLSAAAARSASKLRPMAARQLEDLRRLSVTAEGRDVTVEEVKADIRTLVHDGEFWDGLPELDAEELEAVFRKIVEDERWWLSTADWPRERVVAELPEPDPALVAELRRMRDQLDRRCRRAIQEEVADASAAAQPAALFEAAVMLRRESTTR